MTRSWRGLLALNSVEEGLTDEDAVPEVSASPISVPGDLWLLGEHRVLCGDAKSVADTTRLL